MAAYKITFKSSVEKDLRKIDKGEVPRIVSAIHRLSENPRPVNSKKLVGSQQTYRLRIGEYRVVYIIWDKLTEIEIQLVRHRKDAYR